MRKVFKYTLSLTDVQTIPLPRDAKILSVAEQRGGIVLYAMVDPDECRLYPRVIYIHGTGHLVRSDDLQFIGTVNLDNGDLMFHVFAREAQS